MKVLVEFLRNGIYGSQVADFPFVITWRMSHVDMVFFRFSRRVSGDSPIFDVKRSCKAPPFLSDLKV